MNFENIINQSFTKGRDQKNFLLTIDEKYEGIYKNLIGTESILIYKSEKNNEM